ncbi:MAG: hypothetical protein ACRDKY_12330, partial [Solirubrobacteraceae bacterium]
MPIRIVLAVCAIALVCTATPAGAGPPAPGERIAPNVTAVGLPVSGLTVDEAAAKLDTAFGERLKKGVSVKAAGRLLRMSADRAQVKFDALRTAKRALYAGRALAQTPP